MCSSCHSEGGEELTEEAWNQVSDRHFGLNLSHIAVNPLKIHQKIYFPFTIVGLISLLPFWGTGGNTDLSYQLPCLGLLIRWHHLCYQQLASQERGCYLLAWKIITILTQSPALFPSLSLMKKPMQAGQRKRGTWCLRPMTVLVHVITWKQIWLWTPPIVAGSAEQVISSMGTVHLKLPQLCGWLPPFYVHKSVSV